MKADRQGQRREPIDWGAIRQRLEAARLGAEQALSPGAEKVDRILRERARRLAAPMQIDAETIERIEVVEFLLGQERYAVESRFVREVCPLDSLAPLPCAPAYVVSIANIRGEIISVIDIRKFFDLPERGLTDLNKVIVLHHGKMVFGILADAVTSVRQLAVRELQASLPTLTGIREAYLKGIDSNRVVILDAERLLMDQGLVVQQRATT